MPSLRVSLALVFSCSLVACEPASADEAEGSSETGDSSEAESESESESDESGSETGEGGELCQPERPDGEFFDLAASIDGVLVEGDVEFEWDCTIVGDPDDGVLSSTCPTASFELATGGVAGAAILDVPGQVVHVHLVNVTVWNYDDTWLRLDFVGQATSVFMIDAESLAPSTTSWTNPWSLAVGQECVSDPDIDRRAQSLVLEREGQTLELWQAETAALAEQLEVWVDRSFRYGPGAPAGDGPPSWKELVIVSRGHLAPGELCEPGVDVCGPGLGCCFPCGNGDCEYACGAVDPESGECPAFP
ncbi:hypothetical protein ACNOYE_32055 [Nannocystaceae bacterium ST9]